ncbi:DUF3089 domain-containing protein [Sandaracinobacter sp.]|uniref:DUF3089 domain-containing protein n=1 Tax=Sandaracinobacter sp. TaxID=2487581 RepID=UPI0035AD816E
MARKFLWVIAILTGLVILAAIIWRLFAADLIRMAFVPGGSYAESAAPPAPDYAAKASWVARPDIADNPALWTPEGYSPAPKPAAAVFFVSPTAFLSRSRWNAPLDDLETNDRLDRFTRGQATVFNGVADVWVPRYRQATFGSFLKPGPDAAKALALAYSDVERAFDAFLAAQPADRPIFIAGHSQGALHILHLLKARKAALNGRLVAAYVVGWPVALPEDLPAIGLPACTQAEQAGCVASWQSYAADGDLAEALTGFTPIPDVSGKPLGARAMLCVNPLTGDGAAAGPDRNAGMLVDEALRPRAVGAACDARGLLLINPAPSDIGPFVLPGGNFHVYDFGLFWANIRAGIEARLSAHAARKLGGAVDAAA